MSLVADAPRIEKESAESLQRRLRDGADWRTIAREARRRLAGKPQSASMTRLLTEALLIGNDYGALVALLEPLVRRGLKEPLLLFRYAASQAALGEHGVAVKHYRHLLDENPSYVEAWLNLGVSLKTLSRHDEAIEAYRKALEMQPEMPQAHNNLGLSLQNKGEHEAAVASLEEALRLKPDYARASANLSQSLLKLDRVPEAEAAARKAIELDPKMTDGYINLGLVLMAQNRQEETAEVFRKVVALQPDDARSLTNYGVALKECGQFEAALRCQQLAQALAPEDPTPLWNEAHIRLLLGDYALGWERYEARWGTGDFKSSIRPFKEPYWKGETLKHRRILVHVEQGVGDTVQFCRFLRLLAERHPQAEVDSEVQPSLKDLMRHSFRDLPRLLFIPHVNKPGVNLAPFDVHVPLVALPRLLGVRLDSLPDVVPYLHARNPRSYRREGDKLVVGISWKSVGTTGRKRSLRLERMARLLALPGVRLVDLQYGDTSEERTALTKDHGIELHHDDEVDSKADLGAFADQVAGCDLVVSIDNTTVHMAGALGVPCWVILPYIPDFRWLLQREDTPWYPSLKLYRPPALNDWDGALAKLEANFAALVAGDRSQLSPKRWEGPPAQTAG